MMADEGIEILAGTPRGGGQDRAARAFAGALGAEVGNVAVRNIPGRGGSNAWEMLAARAGNPGVVAISSPTLITNQLQGKTSVGWRDLTPLATFVTEYLAFAVPARSPIADAAELARLLGAEPPTTALATAVGNVNHLGLAMVARIAGGDPRRLPIRVFNSAPEAVADAIEGGSDLAVVSAASVLRPFERGDIRVLAVSAPDRMDNPPLAPAATWSETGVACTIGIWRGLVAAPGIELVRVGAWEELVAGALPKRQWRESVAANVWSNTFLDAAATREFLVAETDMLRGGLQDLGLV